MRAADAAAAKRYAGCGAFRCGERRCAFSPISRFLQFEVRADSDDDIHDDGVDGMPPPYISSAGFLNYARRAERAGRALCADEGFSNAPEFLCDARLFRPLLARGRRFIGFHLIAPRDLMIELLMRGHGWRQAAMRADFATPLNIPVLLRAIAQLNAISRA